tara:strand:- start:137 stop:1138 length:1002 start_codon:yes stop_codon:yes gene_type:complete
MQITKYINFLNKVQKLENNSRYLIDYANITNNDLKYQKNFFNSDNLEIFNERIYTGIPLLIPANTGLFIYRNKFTYDKKKYLKIVYNFNSEKHEPSKNLNLGNEFLSLPIPKKKHLKTIQQIRKYNSNIKNKINTLRKKFKFLAAFQTRNIPHSGHEEIIKYLLTKTNHVVINPLIGPKKSGDLTPKALYFAFRYLKKYYGDKISFFPIIANMFYAGPREAMHHANIREQFGFTHFAVGRDHAGHGNLYKYDLAPKKIRKHNEKFLINLITHFGSYWSKKHDKIVVLKTNVRNKKDLVGISGSEFRKCLKKKLLYKFARKSLQIYLMEQNILK